MANLAPRSGPTTLTTGAVTVYTTPAARKCVLQYIHVLNSTAGAVTFTMSIGTDAAGTRLYDALSIPANSVYTNNNCFIPLVGGEIIQAYASAGTSLKLTLGYSEETDN